MSLQEKAKELIDKMSFQYKFENGFINAVDLYFSKMSAIICCDELISSWKEDDGIHFTINANYWEEVKKFINSIKH